MKTDENSMFRGSCHTLVSQLQRNMLDLRRASVGTFAYLCVSRPAIRGKRAYATASMAGIGVRDGRGGRADGLRRQQRRGGGGGGGGPPLRPRPPRGRGPPSCSKPPPRPAVRAAP